MEYNLYGDDNSKFLLAIKKKAKKSGIKCKITQSYEPNKYYLADWESCKVTKFLPKEYNIDFPEPAVVEATLKVLDKCTLLKGKTVLIIGRGRAVRGLERELVNRDATVIIAHSKTTAINNLILISDIIINSAPISINNFPDKEIIIDLLVRENQYRGDGLLIDGKTIGKMCTDVLVKRMETTNEKEKREH